MLQVQYTITDIVDEWQVYIAQNKDKDLQTIITEEKLNQDNTFRFIENSFRDGEIKTYGTDIDKVLPPVSRFGGENRAIKKQTVINKLNIFFDKYFGVSGK